MQAAATGIRDAPRDTPLAAGRPAPSAALDEDMVTEKPPVLGDAALPLRVVLGTDQVRILVPGWASIPLSAGLMEAAFVLGLRHGPASVPATPEPAGWVGDAPTRFIVGQTDIGVAAGMRAVKYGLEHALAATLTALTDSTDDVATTASDDGPAEPAGSRKLPVPDMDARRRAALAHARNQRTPEVFVEVADLEAEFDRYLVLVEHGTPLMLTRAGHPVALMMPFEMARAEQEARAWVALAYWQAWVGGRFDAGTFTELVDELMTMPPESAYPVGTATGTRGETPPPTSTPTATGTEGTDVDA